MQNHNEIHKWLGTCNSKPIWVFYFFHRFYRWSRSKTLNVSVCTDTLCLKAMRSAFCIVGDLYFFVQQKVVVLVSEQDDIHHSVVTQLMISWFACYSRFFSFFQSSRGRTPGDTNPGSPSRTNFTENGKARTASSHFFKQTRSVQVQLKTQKLATVCHHYSLLSRALC